MLLVGALTPAYLPANSPWWPRLSRVGMSGVTWQVIGSALAITGVIVLVDAWLRLRPGRRASTVDARAKHWAVLAVWILPLLAAPPIFSHDAYSYAAQGWLMENDINPYEGYPGLLPGVFADQVAQEWRFTRTPYGPLSLQLQHDIVRLAGFHPYWSAVMMRIPALVGVVLIGVFLPRLARRTGHDASFAAWFGALNPLLVVDFVGGAHNDSFMMGLMVFGLWLATTASWAWIPAALVIGASAAVKQPAVMAAVALPFIVHPMPSWRPRHVATALGRVVGSLVGAAGSFALITWRTGLGFGWYHAADVPGRVMTVSPSTLIGLAIRSVLTWFGRYGAAPSVVGVTHTIGVGVGAVILVWL
ncbi:MAG: polyprenol phosphomannose-dependent alpha 1,6 mannosyltransferase MptB, partial [Propionibacterium sp.]|nr:polyprenol phosphomannose-dependent alpha 1,6 mannosyltransferase MptB [Propionibacterium sp.]